MKKNRQCVHLFGLHGFFCQIGLDKRTGSRTKSCLDSGNACLPVLKRSLFVTFFLTDMV